MRIRLLGGFAVEVGGRAVAARPWRLRKSRTLVKMLALAPEQQMHRDQLLELLWPDRDASAAANNMHQALHVARRELVDVHQDEGVLVLRDGLVVLRADGMVETDVRRFRELATRAWATRTLDDLAAAVDAYTGELLPEDRFEDWTSGPRDDLRKAFCDLLVAHAAESGRAGCLGAAFESVRRAVEVDPVHEPAIRLCVRLLAEQGRRSEALALYERLRSDLAETYGTDPDPESRRLYRDLLAGSVDTAATPPPLSARSNLQPALTSFVGRERQVAEVHRELSRSRLVTLTGPGGVGKTRLAAEAARWLVDRYRDGVWVVDLAPVTISERLPDAVAEAMRLDPAAGSDPMRVLIGRLATRHLLLLLDNCEHLVDACAVLVRRLLRECPEVRVLTTSREPLHVPSEVTLRVPSLAVPVRWEQAADTLTSGAVRLLLDRARDVRPGFRLDESNVSDVAQICRRLDGVPLAIDLAAVRLGHLEPAEIADRLSSALMVLGSGDRTTRHATLRATMEWSHSLLTEDEKALLRRISIFAGSFTLAAAEGVCAESPLAPSTILDCLGRLVDKSMVQVERVARRSRYRLLETIRQFGREQLKATGEEAALQAAHCAYFLQLALDHDPDRRAEVVARPQSLDEEHDNLRTALAWALRNDPDSALVLAVALWRFWLAQGHFVEGVRWLERALAAASPGPHGQRSRALLAIAVLDARQGRTFRFAELGTAAVAEMAQAGSAVEVSSTCVLAGFLLWSVGDLREAAEIAAQELKRAETLDSPRISAAAYWLRSLVELLREDVPGALACLHSTAAVMDRIEPQEPPFLPAAAAPVVLIPYAGRWIPAFEETGLIGRRVGREQAAGYVWSSVGSAHRLSRDLPSAAAVVRRSAEAFSDLGDETGLAFALNHLGCIERDSGDFGNGREHLQEALRLRRQLGDRRGENLTLANLGMLAGAAGDVDLGRRLGRTALAQSEEVEDRPGVAGTLQNLAVVDLVAGELASSRGLAERAVDAFRPQGYRWLTAWALQFAAELALADGDHGAARRHAAEAAALFEKMGCRLGRPRATKLAAELAAKSR